MRRYGYLERHEEIGIEIPTFPLNTDGIDLWGQDILVENVYIENFDDTVVAKESNAHSFFPNCTNNVVVSCD